MKHFCQLFPCFHFFFQGVTAFLNPSVAGFLLQKELDYLQGAVDEPKRPFAAIVGGSKVLYINRYQFLDTYTFSLYCDNSCFLLLLVFAD